jgi:predicted anti-sigma-YlaC factor YlaD
MTEREPMDHETAQEQFSDYLEGELSAEQARLLEDHLEGCEACRGEFDTLRQTLSSLADLERLAPPTGFVGKVQQRIHRRSRGRFFAPDSLFGRIPFEWISFVIIILLLVVYVTYLQNAADQVPRPAPPGGTERPLEPDSGAGRTDLGSPDM